MSEGDDLRNVALRPWPTQKKEKLDPDDLNAQVNQLAQERGFLNAITEESLQEEIATGKDVTDTGEEDAQTREERLKELQIASRKVWEDLQYV